MTENLTEKKAQVRICLFLWTKRKEREIYVSHLTFALINEQEIYLLLETFCVEKVVENLLCLTID